MKLEAQIGKGAAMTSDIGHRVGCTIQHYRRDIGLALQTGLSTYFSDDPSLPAHRANFNEEGVRATLQRLLGVAPASVVAHARKEKAAETHRTALFNLQTARKGIKKFREMHLSDEDILAVCGVAADNETMQLCLVPFLPCQLLSLTAKLERYDAYLHARQHGWTHAEALPLATDPQVTVAALDGTVWKVVGTSLHRVKLNLLQKYPELNDAGDFVCASKMSRTPRPYLT